MQRSVMSIFAFVLISLLVMSCASMAKVAVHGVKKPVSYSDLPFRVRRSFKLNYQIEVNAFNDQIQGETLDQVLNRELERTPGARGIKNLDVRTYDSALTSMQLFNIIGMYIGLFRAMGGVGIKDVRVTGEIY